MRASSRPTPARRRQRPPDLHALLIQALSDRWRTYRRTLKRCQKQASEEAVHDLRVATRRLLSALDIVRSWRADGDLRRARRRLKRHLARFGPLRDVQVQLLLIDKLLPAFPGLQGFAAALTKRERKLVRRLRTQVKAVKTGKLRRSMRALAAARQAQWAAVLEAVDAAFQRVVDCRRALDPSETTTIHRMRVAFKKFRYMVEAISPGLKAVTASQLKAMNAFQDSMGAIQDLEVFLGSLQQFARQHAGVSEETLIGVCRELSRRRITRIDGFLSSADLLFTFWDHRR
jgi:CHAD domain-containing protein